MHVLCAGLLVAVAMVVRRFHHGLVLLVGNSSSSSLGRDVRSGVVDKRTLGAPWIRVTFRQNLGKSYAAIRLVKVWCSPVEVMMVVVVDVEVGHHVGDVLSTGSCRGMRSWRYIIAGITSAVRCPETRSL